MITNLIVSAAVSVLITTNVVETDNHKGFPMHGWAVYTQLHDGDCLTYTPPTEKYYTTNVVRTTTVSFTAWEPMTLTKEEVIQSTKATFRLKSDWEKVEPIKLWGGACLTNIPIAAGNSVFYAVTNGSIYTIPMTDRVAAETNLLWLDDGRLQQGWRLKQGSIKTNHANRPGTTDWGTNNIQSLRLK